MLQFLSLTFLILVQGFTIIYSTNLPQENCRGDLVSRYCPSTCSVEKQLFLFRRATEKNVAKHQQTLDDIREAFQDIMNSLETEEETILNGLPTTEQKEILESKVREFEKNTSDQRSDWTNFLREIKSQETAIDRLLYELNTLQKKCGQICGESQGNRKSRDMNEGPTSSSDCENDLCRRAAIGEMGSVTQQSENGEMCSEFIAPQAESCAELYERGYRTNGIYSIVPVEGKPSFRVFCDMQDAGGGWMVIQRRVDGSVDFNRTWKEYEKGFGTISCSQEYWLGNGKLASVGQTGFQSARIIMSDWDGETRVAKYSYFKVNRAHHRYTLQISAFEANESNVSDGMTGEHSQNNMRFTTFDQITPSRFADIGRRLYGGWWLDEQAHVNLNGYYYQGQFDPETQPCGIVWAAWKGRAYSIRTTEVKLRPYGFTGS